MEDCLAYCQRQNGSNLCGCPLPQFFTDIEPDEVYSTYSTVLIICLLPILAIYGILGNIFNLWVYCQKSMRCSLNCYLAFLAGGDLVLALTSIFMFTCEALRRNHEHIAQMYYLLIKVVFPLGMIAQTCTVYFTVAAGIDCLITVVYRKYEKKFCIVKRALYLGACIICMSILYNATRWFEISISECQDYESNETFTEVCESSLRQNPTYKKVYHLHLSTLVMTVGPLLILLGVNIMVIRSVSTQRRNWKALALTASGRCPGPINNDEHEQVPESSADTASLICVVCLFIFCNALSLIINFLENFADMPPSILSYFVDISNFLVVLNSSVNFTIYMLCGTNFRHCFKSLICSFFGKVMRNGCGRGNYCRHLKH